MKKSRLFSSVIALTLASVPASSFAGVGLSLNLGAPRAVVVEPAQPQEIIISQAPPPLIAENPPPPPGDGYIWTPGYYGYNQGVGYYWIPGAWVFAPQPGYLWTPGYWSWDNGVYVFHNGYWGAHVGYYGGINYGYGYTGHGYYGGRWDNGHFLYNSDVYHFGDNRRFRTYNEHVDVGIGGRTSFNGGRDGIRDEPNEHERGFEQENHIQATQEQRNHTETAHEGRPDLAHPGFQNHQHPQNHDHHDER